MEHVDMTGQRFGKLVVVSYAGASGVGARWNCLCDCGTMREVYRNNLIRNQIRSCGCLRRQLTSDRAKTHGMTHTPTYISWSRMRSRCFDPNNHTYHRYGGRGITVCGRWESFENFIADMGERPEGRTLDRIDNDGPYSPENCKWSTQKEQTRNMARTVKFQGKTLREWSEELGIKYATLGWRMRKHKTIFLK